MQLDVPSQRDPSNTVLRLSVLETKHFRWKTYGKTVNTYAQGLGNKAMAHLMNEYQNTKNDYE
jgi:hypothetical protein